MAYFAITIGAGFFFSRKSATSIQSYFLGDNQSKWWMLAASGSASNYSISGTIWFISILIVLGMKSWWLILVFWLPSSIFLMSYSGIWIRRTGVMTAAELNRIRFGTDRGARWGRTAFSVMILLFSVVSLGTSYIAIHKFASIFGLAGHATAITVMGVTSIYVLVGGFRGVILTDFLQTILLFAISFIVGYVCYTHYTAAELHGAIAKAGVASDYWKSLVFDATPNLGVFAESSYSNWGNLLRAMAAFSVVGFLGCIGGAGGRYGEQRFLATRTVKEAGWMAALWTVLAVPRWLVIAGIAFIGFTMFGPTVVAGVDPDAALPLFLKADLLGSGIKGLVAVGFVAAYMSTFSSEINASASIIVRDLYQPMTRSEDDSGAGHMLPSYLATAALAVISISLGYLFVEKSDLNGIFSWMMSGLLSCIVVPLALRWFWGRMNGWGFTAGCLLGLLPSFAMLAKTLWPELAVLKGISNDALTYAILLSSLGGCVIGSLATAPIREEEIDEFYRRVRPFGVWGSIEKRVKASGNPMATKLSFGLVAVNSIIGCVGMLALYMVPPFVMGHWFFDAAVAAGVFIACAIALYFTWFKTLPDD
jgi:solute:Na+ symporter, SSS family